jgi:hypothetical protein
MGLRYDLADYIPSAFVLFSLILYCKFRDKRGMNSPSLHNSIRKVCALVAATLILPALASLSFSAQAAEKKKVMGTNKYATICRTVVPLGPGDDPKHELVVLAIYRATTTSSDPDTDGTELIAYEQADEVAGTGTARGYFRRLHKNGDIDYGTYEQTHKTSFKEDGSWEATTWEATWKSLGGTGKFKNIKGSGTERGKATAQESLGEFEGEVEY